MKQIPFLGISLILLIVSCIGNDFVDDRVDPVLRLTNPIDSIAIDSSYQFEFMYLNNVGREESVETEWSSSDETIISINENGIAHANNSGSATIMVQYENGNIQLSDEITIGVGERTIVSSGSKSGTVSTTSTYKLEGSFVLTQESGDLLLEFNEDYEASTALPGLFVYLSNNPSTISGAKEIQAVEIFKGKHSYIISDTDINQYKYVLYFCKPFNVKVGHGEIED